MTSRQSFQASTIATLRAPFIQNSELKTQNSPHDVLICIFQRGGADGLNMVVPHGDKDYYTQRASLAIPQPGASGAAIDLDGFFGLHPALGALKEIWDAKQLAIIHACGSPDPTHSHFDAMDYMERGTPGQKSIATGWLGRHMAATEAADDSPFRAVGFGALLQASLRGGAATALTSLRRLSSRRDRSSYQRSKPRMASCIAGRACWSARGSRRWRHSRSWRSSARLPTSRAMARSIPTAHMAKR